MVVRTKVCRRRGRTRKHKYPSKAAGHPAIRKKVGDGKQCDRQYTPCGCQEMCNKNCPCVENGTCCEKYCGYVPIISSKNPLPTFMHPQYFLVFDAQSESDHIMTNDIYSSLLSSY